MPIRRAIFGRSMFGRDMFVGRIAGAAEDAIVHNLYQLDLRNGSNTRLAELCEWTSGAYTQEINRPSLLEFSYPYDGEHRSSLVYPNMVGLFDQYGDLLDRLRIV